MNFIHRLLLRLPLSKGRIEAIIQFEAAVARRWVAGVHQALMEIQWGLPPQPEHFDHHIDLYYLWLATRNPLWLERGVFGSLALRGGGTHLNLPAETVSMPETSIAYAPVESLHAISIPKQSRQRVQKTALLMSSLSWQTYGRQCQQASSIMWCGMQPLNILHLRKLQRYSTT